MSEEIKVSEMQEAKEINDEDLLMLIQKNANKKVTIKQIKNLFKIIDNLTSASTIDALSAKQGKILNDKIINTNTYSTEEVNTGKKWIDGKDIYRRVFVATKTSDNLVIKIADNIDFSYLFSGRLRAYALPFYESEQVYCRAELENNYVTIKGGSSPYSQGTITLIIEYTKTS